MTGHIFELEFMLDKPWPDLLTLSETFYDLSVSCNLFSKSEMLQFGASGTEVLNKKIYHNLNPGYDCIFNVFSSRFAGRFSVTAAFKGLCVIFVQNKLRWVKF